VHRRIEEYVRGLGLDAYVVGGAVRDELLGLEAREADFLVAGVDHEQLRAALEPHGKIEDLEVAGQRVGVRLYPRDRELRELVPAGIEFAPPRAERSTGPGRHDFVIVADPSLPVEEDMRRRDFTINAIARSVKSNEIIDPCGGREDLEKRVLRTVSPRSFAEDPLRLVRALRFVSQLGFDPDETTVAQMREEASSIRLVSGERIGGGLHADGLGELSKLLLGREPLRALRLARDTGVLVELLPPFGPAIGYETGSARQGMPLEEHIFAVVQEAADAADPLPVRLAALLHDLGKPGVDVAVHAERGAEIARRELRRLRYPARLQTYVGRLVAEHAFFLNEAVEPLLARRFLRLHGDELAFDLARHKRADLRAKPGAPADELAQINRLLALLEQERASPHRVGDLAIDGADLLELGYREGPQLGRTLDTLLDEVVEEPERNETDALRARARELLETT
jgi:tRNA nucleotidyltransferase (CCA-adding enzyme)